MSLLNNVRVAYRILILVVVATIAMIAIAFTGYSHLKKLVMIWIICIRVSLRRLFI